MIFMGQFARPKVVISRCIEFDRCRYDGSMITSDFVKALKPHVDFLPVCPEMDIGLGAPRDTVRIVSVDGTLMLMQPARNLDLTAKMKDFTSRFLTTLPEVDGFILKFRSPSCGMKDIRVYSAASKSGAISKAAGFFGGAVIDSFSDLAVEDEGRLRNFNIREHFLTKLYTLSAFRKARSENMLSSLNRFHETNKLLLMAHSQKETRMLGSIIANHEGLDFIEISTIYREHLAKALKRPPRSTSKANVFMHVLGYFKDKLSSREKELFLQNIQRYKNKKIHSSVLLAMLQSWTEGFGQEYIRNQSIFEPFPEELVELCQDSQCEWAAEELFAGQQ
jgi:uncharacterized protein YbgA (DUF1722 family)/uncharacterized protein YbbK (DUF523 family)